MVFFIGFRGETGPDSYNYMDFLKNNTITIWNWEAESKGYAEYGFYYLSVILKSIFNNVNFYFISISFLTFIFLLKVIKVFAIYPLLSFVFYYARFLMLRDMNQIRAALAILVVVYALSFLVKGDRTKYFGLILCALTLHLSTCIALVFGYLYEMRISMFKMILILIISTVIGLIGGAFLKHFLVSTGYVVFLTYVDGADLGIANPVILFQVICCVAFFMFEKLLCDRQYGYYVIRNAYLFSTVILLLTSSLGEIGGRLATQFATCEIFILPALICTIRPRIMGYLFVTAVVVFIFYLNYSKMLLLPNIWEYNINI